MSVKFSIIIPVYKVEAYLPKCLDSVLNQSCSDWECICVDDGSPDGCGAILDAYAKRDMRFCVVHQQNRGVSAARNVALDIAKGDWVQFLDSDDSLVDDFLAQLADKIVHHPDADTFEHSAVYCYEDGSRKIGTESGRLPPACVIMGEDVLADPYGVKYTNLARCSCYKIFRRSVIEANRLRFIEGVPISEDAIFATQFYVCAKKVVVVPDVAGYLRIFRTGSALFSEIGVEKLWPQEKCLQILFDMWEGHQTLAFARRLSVGVLSLLLLGKGKKVRKACIDKILDSKVINTRGLPFLLKHGTVRGRVLAGVYLMAPRFLRRKILERL